MNTVDEYWIESVTCSFEEHQIEATPEQIQGVAYDFMLSAENKDLAFPTPRHPAIDRVKELERELDMERSKVTCDLCKGSGDMVMQGHHHSAWMTCWKCKGEGRVVRAHLAG